MTKRLAGLILAALVGILPLSAGSPAAAQMGPGMMGGAQTSPMPMQQMSELVKQLAERLASGKTLDAERGERLRRLADQLVGATGRMASGTGGMMGPGMMGGGMMGQGSEQMAEVTRILSQISELVRGQ